MSPVNSMFVCIKKKKKKLSANLFLKGPISIIGKMLNIGADNRSTPTKYCCKLLFGKPDSVSLFRRCVKPYVYSVFLRLPCESIPQRQLFHLADKLITAREFNAHVRPACTGGCAYSTRVLFWWRNLRHAHCTLSLTYTYKVKYIWPLD